MGNESETRREKIAALRTRPAGDDPADPYDDVDVSTLPDWWRESIRTFEKHGLRPYRPPRFEDGAMKHAVVDRLEAELGISIRVRGLDVEYGDDWTVLIDDEPVADIGRRRSPEGYSVFELDSEAFESLVRSHVER